MTTMATAAASVKKAMPMFFVPDMRATVRWYQSMGFTLDDAYEDEGELLFARLSLGAGELTLSPGPAPGPREVRFWLLTDRVEELYRAMLARGAEFDEELYDPFYGGRQFSIRDLNGLALVFWQPEWLSAPA